MQREPHVLLWDICHAADAVAAFTHGKRIEDYKEDPFLRSAVERQLIILGEAVVQLSKLTPEVAERIPERGSIIAFRNLLIHGYAVVVDEIVWGVLEDDLPGLRSRAAELIEELAPEPDEADV
jgi:uncharacterized protein with HEPN domain